MIGKKILNYHIISLLGEGGMGSVYKAYDLQLERYVAIKIIKPNLIKDPVSLERFRFEAKNQAKLNHPNIVTVYGFIETREATGFVMEFVDGTTISQLISNYGRLDLIYSLRVIQQVLLAIEYAHSSGFVHRDLKPSNIIIDKNGIVKIMDFGISKSLHESQKLTRVGFNIGTIHYMSPEQIRGLNPTPSTDIYSLGITLYEMISGSPPFDSKSDYEIYEAHLKMIPSKLSQKFSDIPEEVDELILGALNKSLKKNFLSAYEFRSSIEHLIFNLPLLLDRLPSNQIRNNETRHNNHRVSNFIIAFVVLLTMAFAVVGYFLFEKYILKEKISSTTENREKINYLSTQNFFPDTWQEIKLNSSSNILTINQLHSILFIAGNNGGIFLSKDYGNSWEKISLAEDIEINDSDILNDEILLIGSSGHLYVLSSTGKIIKSLKLYNENLLSINIKDNIYVCGSGGLLLKADKKNLNFQKLNAPASVALFDIWELSDGNFLTCGWDGIVYKTSDDGKTYRKIKLSNTYLKKFFFINQFLGFVGGSDGKLFKSTDGGDSWSQVDLSTNATINDIIFINQKVGYILTSDGNLFISENSGEDWVIAYSGSDLSLNKILILKNGMIFIVGNNGTILKNKI